jgi:hypothetical protein
VSPAFSERVTQIAPYGIFEIAKLAKARKDSIYLNLGEPDFTTPPRIREAAKRAIDEGFTHYTHDWGIPELREAIADKVRSFNGFEADPEREIKVTAGSQEALYITLATILRPVIHGCRVMRSAHTAPIVALLVGGLLIATSSTMFANPQMTLARMFTASIAGVRPVDGLVFIVIQMVAALVASRMAVFLFRDTASGSQEHSP